MSLFAILLALLMMLLQGMIPAVQPNREAKAPEEVIVSEHTEVPAAKPTAAPSDTPAEKPTVAPTPKPTTPHTESYEDSDRYAGEEDTL